VAFWHLSEIWHGTALCCIVFGVQMKEEISFRVYFEQTPT